MIYELDTWSRELNSDFILKDYLFGGVELAENVKPDKYKDSGYCIGFHLGPLPNFDWAKNIINFGVDMSSSVHINNNKKKIR